VEIGSWLSPPAISGNQHPRSVCRKSAVNLEPIKNIPGAFLLAATWIPVLAKKLESKAVQAVCMVLGLILVAYAVIN